MGEIPHVRHRLARRELENAFSIIFAIPIASVDPSKQQKGRKREQPMPTEVRPVQGTAHLDPTDNSRWMSELGAYVRTKAMRGKKEKRSK